MFSGNIHPGKVHLLIVFRNPAWLVGLPDFYPTLLCVLTFKVFTQMLGSCAARAPSDES